MCELLDVIGDSGIAYCTIPAIDRSDPECKTCKANMGCIEAIANEINKLQRRVWVLEKLNSKKKEIENAIRGIDGLLLDFGDAVSSLRDTKELLYSFIEKEPEDEERNG